MAVLLFVLMVQIAVPALAAENDTTDLVKDNETVQLAESQ